MRQIGLLCYLLIFMKSSNCAQKVRCKSALARQGLGSSENELYGFLSRITPSDDLKNQAIKNEHEIYYCNKITTTQIQISRQNISHQMMI